MQPEVDRCIDCGETTDCLLPSRFPHICATCLFPPPKPEDPTADVPDVVESVGLVKRLDTLAHNARWLGGYDSFGKGLPESHSRKPWE